MSTNFCDVIGPLNPVRLGPRYLELQARLRNALASGRLAPQQALPSERELCTDFGLSRVTVRKAMDGLVAEGLLVRLPGAGTFVARSGDARPRVEKSFSKLSSFSEDMTSRGRSAKSTWISRATGTVTPEEALSLGLSPGSSIYRFHRIRYADGAPMALEYSTIAGYCLASADAVDESLYDALQAAGNRPVRALQRLRAVAFTAEQADRLDVPAGHAGLLIERRSFLSDGRTAEHTRSYYRGDAYDFVAELSDL